LEDVERPRAGDGEQESDYDRRGTKSSRQRSASWAIPSRDEQSGERGNGRNNRKDIEVLFRGGKREEDHDHQDPQPQECANSKSRISRYTARAATHHPKRRRTEQTQRPRK